MTTKCHTNNAKENKYDEKAVVAFSSILAAIFLTIMKLSVGLMTNSLGILAEAIHSGMDLLAAVVTFFAVRKASKPPDEKHQFGHEKVENFSALVETFILGLSCLWIFYEAIHRLQEGSEVEFHILGLVVMLISIFVDISRSRVLYATAKKHNSQALEADALHFSSDIWSSLAVLIGLVLIYIANEFNQPFLIHADAIAAIFVAIIIAFVTFRLGMRTMDVLLDAAPKGTYDALLAEIQEISEVKQVERIRMRVSGPRTYVDVIVEVTAGLSTLQSHNIASNIEKVIQQRTPNADIMVHVEPSQEKEDTSLSNKIRGIAGQFLEIRGIHNILIHNILGEGIFIDLHAEFPNEMSIHKAHQVVDLLEKSCIEEIENLNSITVHIERYDPDISHTIDVTSQFPEIIEIIKSAANKIDGILDIHHVIILKCGSHFSLSFHCNVADELSVSDGHTLSERLETLIKIKIPFSISEVLIHLEPTNKKQ